MKQIIIIISGLVLLSSCKKDNAARLQTKIAGRWEYITYSGYPFTFTPLPPGNGRIIVIGSDGGSFERRNHDTVIFKGNYMLEERKDCYGEEKYVFFSTNDPSFVNNAIINVSGDSLFISTPNCLADGGTSIYRKL